MQEKIIYQIKYIDLTPLQRQAFRGSQNVMVEY